MWVSANCQKINAAKSITTGRQPEKLVSAQLKKVMLLKDKIGILQEFSL